VITNPENFFKPGFRVWIRSNPGFGLGFGFWIFTNENVEADDRIVEKLHRKCIYGGHAVVNRSTRDRRLYIRWNEVKIKDKDINKHSA